MKIDFSELAEADMELVKEIYDYYIENSTATYYTERISADELREFIPVHDPKYKSFIVKAVSEPCGFCYLSQYKKRQAYDRTAEISLYLKVEYTGKEIGKIVLDYLEKVAKANGISVLLAIISGDNENSIKLFAKNGFEKCAHYRQIGEKFNKILDVVAYQKILQ
jgi:L-amino acid N-acyltransferase YncA